MIGTRKIAYDLWGSTVIVASRMEGLSAPGEITLSAECYTCVAEAFEVRERQPLHVKGLGQTTTYLLLGRKTAAPPAAEAENHARVG